MSTKHLVGGRYDGQEKELHSDGSPTRFYFTRQGGAVHSVRYDKRGHHIDTRYEYNMDELGWKILGNLSSPNSLQRRRK